MDLQHAKQNPFNYYYNLTLVNMGLQHVRYFPKTANV